jgi:hypothetical protein
MGKNPANRGRAAAHDSVTSIVAEGYRFVQEGRIGESAQITAPNVDNQSLTVFRYTGMIQATVAANRTVFPGCTNH